MNSNNDITIKNAAELGDGVRDSIGEIFVDGFYQWLQYFSKDKKKLSLAFRHMFNLDVFYVACVGDDIAGIAACTNGKTPCVKLNPKELRRHLGFVSGMIAGFVLRDQFEKHTYPFILGDKTGFVEFVATSLNHRGKGVASAIIRHFFLFQGYDAYVLEVADTNTNAVTLYDKLGFREFTRVKMKNQRRSGVNFLVYMKYQK